MITVKVIPLKDVLESNQRACFEHLLCLQWQEVDHRRKTSDFNVDFDKYLTMQDIGMHYIVFALDAGMIIGYMSMFCAESPHTREITATTDTIYIDKKYRKNGLGVKMIKTAEEEAKNREAKHIMITFKNDQKHPKIVEECGFFSYETIYSKYIGG